jgi:DNA polymerase I-like protein with 3'-5' exonuclease and polymerase domains
MLLQVHDELVFDDTIQNWKKMKEMIKYEMEN